MFDNLVVYGCSFYVTVTCVMARLFYNVSFSNHANFTLPLPLKDFYFLLTILILVVFPLSLGTSLPKSLNNF